MDERIRNDRLTANDAFDVLSVKPSKKDILSAYWGEWKKNSGLEAFCVGACEVGDTPTILLASHLGAGSLLTSSLGFAAGVAMGVSYATHHIKRDAKEHGLELSPKEIALSVITAESACILSATGTTSTASYIAGETYSNTSPEGRLIVLSSLPFAYLIGTTAMSILTLNQKKEAGRMISEKGKIPELTSLVYNDLGATNGQAYYGFPFGEVLSNNNSITLRNKKSYIRIKEEELPKSYHEDFNPEENSLYLIHSNLAQYLPETRKNLESFLENSFEEIGALPSVVKNPLIHDHSHSHKHNHS